MNTFIAKVSGKLHEARISNVNYELGKVKESIIHESSSYVESIISRSESIRFSQIFSSKRASKENENRREVSRLSKSSSLPAISSSVDAKKYKYKSSLQCPEEADEEERRNEDPWSPISTTKTVDESVIDKFIRVVEVKEPAVRRTDTPVSRIKAKTREDIRKKLAVGGLDSASSASTSTVSGRRLNGYKRGFQETSGGDLQICFINQIAGSDEEDDTICNRSEAKEDKYCTSSIQERTEDEYEEEVYQGTNSDWDSFPQGSKQSQDFCHDVLLKRRVALRKSLVKLQTEVKGNLEDCRLSAKRQIDRSKCRRHRSDTLGKLLSLPALEPETTCGRKFDAAFLHTLNVAKLQVIVNHYHNDFERLNDELVQLLLDKDELQIEQDGQLLDIEDLSCSFRW